MEGSASEGDLLVASYVRALETLRRSVRQRVVGQRSGDHRSARKGVSVEFAEHRPYAPGDDPRRIDWNADARLGELVVRLFVAEEDVTVHLLVDASESMTFGAPSKWRLAQRVAAGLGYLSLTAAERVSLTLSMGAEVRPMAPLRGRGSVATLVRQLSSVTPGGTAQLARAAMRCLSGSAGRGAVAVVVTDALDRGVTESVVARLAAARHDTTLVHVLSDEELHPRLDDDAALLVDAETGEEIELAVDPELLAEYEARLVDWSASLATHCAARGVRYVKAFGAPSPFDVVARTLVG